MSALAGWRRRSAHLGVVERRRNSLDRAAGARSAARRIHHGQETAEAERRICRVEVVILELEGLLEDLAECSRWLVRVVRYADDRAEAAAAPKRSIVSRRSSASASWMVRSASA